jgi:hypothetical protein
MCMHTWLQCSAGFLSGVPIIIAPSKNKTLIVAIGPGLKYSQSLMPISLAHAAGATHCRAGPRRGPGVAPSLGKNDTASGHISLRS